MKYVGTIGDVRHFKIKGEKGYFAGLVGGPTAEQVLTGDEFKRTRENMAEFGGCAKAGKAVRTAFSPLQHMFGNRLTGTLTATMKRINRDDNSEARGQRAILITQVPQYLEGLDFNPKLSLSSVLRIAFTLNPQADRRGSTLMLPKFLPANYLNIPSGATHFRLINAVAAISDYQYVAETNTYEPKEAEQNGVADIRQTEYFPLDTNTPDVALETVFPNDMKPKEEVAVLNAVGIEFYQKVGDIYYVFASGNALQLVEVF